MKTCLGPAEEVDISFSWLPSLPLTVRVVLGHMHHQEKVVIACLQALVKQFRTNVPYGTWRLNYALHSCLCHRNLLI